MCACVRDSQPQRPLATGHSPLRWGLVGLLQVTVALRPPPLDTMACPLPSHTVVCPPQVGTVAYPPPPRTAHSRCAFLPCVCVGGGGDPFICLCVYVCRAQPHLRPLLQQATPHSRSGCMHLSTVRCMLLLVLLLSLPAFFLDCRRPLDLPLPWGTPRFRWGGALMMGVSCW